MASEFAIPMWFNFHSIPHEETEKSCELIPFQTFFKKIDVQLIYKVVLVSGI